MKQNQSKIKYIIFILIILFFFALILKFFDLIINWSKKFGRTITEKEKLILPPNTKVKYYTNEFNIIVSTNQFGFRGNEKNLKERQIIVVGDSQVYGWGLRYEDTWPYLLELTLLKNGKNFEVYNLGAPGTHTNNHISIAKNYIKEIKPKIAIIAIGISDDFQQILEEEIELKKKSEIEKNTILERSYLKQKIYEFYPNVYSSLKKIRYYDYNQIYNGYLLATKDWKNINSNKSYSNEILELMKKGFINPGIFQYANSYPERNLSFYKNISINNSHESEIFKKISLNIKELKELSTQNNTQLILLSIPSGSYVESKNFENLKKFGFLISNEDLETFLPEEILENMSNEINVNFIKTLKLFRDLKKETFFPYDGHFNTEGAKFMSEIVYNYLEKNFF